MHTTLIALLLAFGPAPAAAPVAPALPPPAAGKPLVCGGKDIARAAAPKGDPETRRAAQRGLAYLARASAAWTQQHQCFGCHVQAVTVEAFAVGKHHRYDVQARDVDGMVKALLLGVTAGGATTGAAFEGQAWARYDQWIDGQRTGELLKYAAQLVTLQQQDGSIPDDDARLPVTGGAMHTTYQAMQTWRQAYARTADDKWLAPIRRAERYLAAQSAQWNGKSDVYIQNINFALLGLVAAGVGPAEQSSLRLQRMLLARQNQDGGWALDRQDERRAGHRADAVRAEARRPHGRRIRHRARLALAGEQAGRRRGVAHGAQRAGRRREGRRHVGGAGAGVHRRDEHRGERPRGRTARRRHHGDRHRRARQPDGRRRQQGRGLRRRPAGRRRVRREAGVVVEDRRACAKANTWSTSSRPTRAARRAAAASRCSRATSS